MGSHRVLAEEGRKGLGPFVVVVVTRTISPKKWPPCEGRAKRSLRFDLELIDLITSHPIPSQYEWNGE
jgi:hypothetical protein